MSTVITTHLRFALLWTCHLLTSEWWIVLCIIHIRKHFVGPVTGCWWLYNFLLRALHWLLTTMATCASGPNNNLGRILTPIIAHHRMLRTRSDRPRGPTSVLCSGYWVYSGLKRPGRGADHPHPLQPRGGEFVADTGPSPLWACIGVSRGDLLHMSPGYCRIS